MAQQYPLPRYHYQVDWGGVKISFTEVTGMDQQVEVIEYRHSDSKDFSKIKMPGMRKFSNITLKRGKFEGDFDYNNWLDEISNNPIGNPLRCSCSFRHTDSQRPGARRHLLGGAN